MNKKMIMVALAAAGISSAFVAGTMLKGVDIASMDKKANPKDDFYQYANGSWCKANPVPASEPRWTSFNILAEKNNELLKKILEDAAKDHAAEKGSARQKVGDFYRVAMDTVKLEKEGLTPVKQDLVNISKISTPQELVIAIGVMHRKGIPALFNFDVSPDIKNSSQYISYIAQGGIGLPDRDYYFKEDEKSQKIRAAYQEYMANMLSIYLNMPHDGAAKRAEKIFNIEAGLARVSMTRTERRNLEKQYNKRSMDELRGMMPAFDWGTYLATMSLADKHVDEVIVAQPDFFTHVNQQLKDLSLDEWKAYLEWKLINTSAGYLSNKPNQLNFEFYGTVLTGTKEQKPRWKRVVGSANALIGELVGQEYVKVAFSPESKRRVNEMVDNLREAFRARIEKLDWMSAETKTKALEKLESFNRKLGYPDKWKDYSKLNIIPDNYLNNYYRANEFAHEEMIAKLGKPVDRNEWEMLPQTVNAYYSPAMNEIVFPAAIMQPPFFNPEVDDAVNYGAIGAVIGHEFSHGFDDQGSKFDAKGNMNNWWTADDKKKFDERTKVLVDQYSKFSVEDKVYVNGELTLGENIADFAGLTVSYDAYELSLKNKKREVIDGFTPEQRFFIGFAQVWKNNARPEFLRQQVMTDPHSPGRFRVLGPLANMPQFYSAFNIKTGDKMYIDEAQRAKIW